VKYLPCAVLVSRPHTLLLFYQYLNWFKAFWVDKVFVLATFSDSKLITNVTNTAVFFIRSAVFSEECYMEKIALLFV